jgi:nucleoside-diphosphate-sugar epimerase
MKLSSAKLRALGWKPEYDLEQCYRRMMGTMAGREKSGREPQKRAENAK